MSRRSRPLPPRPDLVRRPLGGFGWLEQRLLFDGWLRDLGPKATSVLVLLVLAADRHGASFFGRVRMATLLGITCDDVDLALARLTELGLVDHRPWHAGVADGVWQLLPVPIRNHARASAPVSVADILARMGLVTSPTADAEHQRQRAPPNNGES